jgi:uncharacterized Zn finger protein
MGVAIRCPRCGKEVNSDEVTDKSAVRCPNCELLHDGKTEVKPTTTK